MHSCLGHGEQGTNVSAGGQGQVTTAVTAFEVYDGLTVPPNAYVAVLIPQHLSVTIYLKQGF